MNLRVLQIALFLFAIDHSSSQSTLSSWPPYRDSDTYNRGIQSLFTCPAHELSRDMNSCEMNVPLDSRPKILLIKNVGDVSNGFISYRHYFGGATNFKCAKMAAYYSVTACQYKAIHNCLPGNHQALLPHLEQLRDGMQFLCDSHSHLNVPCLVDKMPDFEKCILHQGFDHPEQMKSATLEQNTCRSHEYAVDCVAKSFTACGWEAINVYKQAMKYTKSVVCSSTIHISSLLLTTLCVLCNML